MVEKVTYTMIRYITVTLYKYKKKDYKHTEHTSFLFNSDLTRLQNAILIKSY